LLIIEDCETGNVSHEISSYAGLNSIIILTMLLLFEPYLAMLSKVLTVK